MKRKQMSSCLAINGGPQAIQAAPGKKRGWPIITREDEKAVLDVLRTGTMSGSDVSEKFEQELAKWHARKYALVNHNGTAAVQAAMYGCGIGVGDEVICQSLTYWASCLQVFSLGGTVVFAETDPDTLTIMPSDIEHRITGRTKAIICVHYCGYPTDMDPILKIARRHKLKVIEDFSQAHGGRYKGRLIGTMGDVGAASLMSGKPLPAGEAGFLVTDNKEIFERAVAFGHYRRHDALLTMKKYRRDMGLPFGGYKYRPNQLASALGLSQLKRYTTTMAEIQKAMNHFWDLLDGVPGIRAHRPKQGSRSTMGGWYSPIGLYVKQELEGLPIEKFCEAVTAEGFKSGAGLWNAPLHLHPVFNRVDIYGHGKPTRIAHSRRDLRQPEGSLPIAESIPERVFSIPYFSKYEPRKIRMHATAFRKVAEHADEIRR
jgi:dTDP-4-amino-4,6-dideoxygalactose transaminase